MVIYKREGSRDEFGAGMECNFWYCYVSARPPRINGRERQRNLSRQKTLNNLQLNQDNLYETTYFLLLLTAGSPSL